VLHAALGEHDKVYPWLERGVRERADFMHSLRTNPFLIGEWKDPRFAEILQQMRLGPPRKV